MGWLLIVLVSGSVAFTNVSPDKDSCETMGKLYNETIVTSDYMCVSVDAIKNMIGE